MQHREIGRVGVLTSGGDAPGMHPCVRAVIRSAVQARLEVLSFKRGYSGNEFRVSVLGYLQRGGAATARDRLLAARLGVFAVESVVKGTTAVMVGE